MGGYVSFSGILTFPKSREIREIARELPADRLLVETDAPTSRRCRYAASATSRPMSRIPPRCWPTSVGLNPRRRPSLTTANFRRLFRKAA